MDADLLPYAGKLAALAASIIWSCSISLYKAHGHGVPAQVLNLNKLLVALIGFSLIVGTLNFLAWHGMLQGSYAFPKSWEKTGWLMASGVIGLTLGDTFFFASIRYLGAALTAALQCLTPPLNALIDWIYLGKSMNNLQVLGMVVIVVAVAGVILAAAPQKSGEKVTRRWLYGLGTSIASAICTAGSYALTGEMLKNESIFPCVLLRVIPAFLVLALITGTSTTGRQGMVMLWSQPRKLGYLILAAFLGTIIGISLQAYAFQLVDTGIVSTLSTTYPIFVIPVAAYFLKEHPTPMQIVWTFLAIIGIALLTLPASVWSGWLT